MASYYSNQVSSNLGAGSHSSASHSAYPSAMPASSHHGGRNRRTGRFASAQSHPRHRNHRNPKEAADALMAATFRMNFEAARSFDIEDDEMFCPWHLLTQDDIHSIHSSSSDRSSMSSGSPEASPLQQQLQPTPTYPMPTSSSQFHQATPFTPGASTPLKLHQPSAQRVRNAIPIVDPNTRALSSPPPSVSPARMQKSSIVARW